jgi:predicted PurR-regulated permease PerM
MPMTVASDLHDHAEAETHGPGRATTGDVFRLLALAAMTAVLIGLCIVLAVPFLPAITWSVALAIVAWPLHRWVARHVRRPNSAAALSSAAVAVAIAGPLVVAVPG